MATKSRFFRVAVEGATCDGRTIERSWIQDIADTYDRATYGARVNMEHIRGVTGAAPFQAYGDVEACEAREIELTIGGKKQKKLALFAQITPTDELVALTGKNQKIYTSIEVSPDFAKTGKAGLVGLAVTDNPASLGTEILSFAAKQGDNNPFASRKADKGNFISEAIEAAIEYEPDADAEPAADSAAGMFAAATAFFAKLTKGEPATPPAQAPATPPEPANDNAQFAAVMDGIGKLTAGMAKFQTEVTGSIAKLQGEHDALKASLENNDDNKDRRKPATGGASFARTDC